MSLTTGEMIQIASEAHLLRIMGSQRRRSVTLDIIPQRGRIIVPRINEDDDSLTAPRPSITTLRYHLEDAMFGMNSYAAVTCQGRMIVEPFRWVSWQALATLTIKVS